MFEQLRSRAPGSHVPSPLLCRLSRIGSRANALRVHLQLRAAGSRPRCSAELSRRARSIRATCVGLVARLSLGRAHQADRGGADRQSRHRRRHRRASCRPMRRARSPARRCCRCSISPAARPSKPPGGTVRDDYRVALDAAYEIDFWGKNRAASRAAQETAVAPASTRKSSSFPPSPRRDRLFPGALVAGSAADRAQNLAAANRVLTLIKQRARGRHRVPARRRPAGEPGGDRAGGDPAVRPDAAPERRRACRADRSRSGRFQGQRRQPLSAGIPRVTPGLPSELLLQRPDIRAAEADLASADASVEAARAAFFPSISLTGQGGYESAVLKLLFTPQTAFYNIALNVAQPLLDGFRLEGQLELAQGPAIRVAEGLLPDRFSPASATWKSPSLRSPTPPSASVCSRSSSTPRDRPSSSPKTGFARARSISSPCCRPSRPCSRPRTIWRSHVLHVCRRY